MRSDKNMQGEPSSCGKQLPLGRGKGDCVNTGSQPKAGRQLGGARAAETPLGLTAAVASQDSAPCRLLAPRLHHLLFFFFFFSCMRMFSVFIPSCQLICLKVTQVNYLKELWIHHVTSENGASQSCHTPGCLSPSQ